MAANLPGKEDFELLTKEEAELIYPDAINAWDV